MSNSKISALTSATTPLAGTEVLPIVQSSATKQVSIANLTVGRAIGVTSVQFGSGTVLSAYEEGTWTPVATSSAGAITSYAAGQCTYVKVGKSVMVRGSVGITVGGTAAGELRIDGLPYTSRNYTDGAPASVCLVRESALTGIAYQGILLNNGTRVAVATLTNSGVPFTNGLNYIFETTYEVA